MLPRLTNSTHRVYATAGRLYSRSVLATCRPACQPCRSLSSAGSKRGVTTTAAGDKAFDAFARVNTKLPEPEKPLRRWLRYGAYATVGVVVWKVCLGLAFNQQRLNSSVMSGALFAVQHDPAVIAVLGEGVQLAKQYAWLPRPFVLGTVNQLHGVVDIRFNVAGNRGNGVVHFRSTRAYKTANWTTDLFHLQLENGQKIELPSAEAMAEATEVSALT
ncbi:cytochrome oxidase complex assembly protein 1-domain-containing protein [Thamnocephalis sphaerospora]|uniref:Cytochrome oxidase complex assembly protein 1-domain-containing protein n=1 Tax=Thamnocephalis sphaerospora TaxID=78915 RepID=A0A4P9XXK5_9FUNG|nr:cytochrome oxidase complex assembly protein 1-domain-containing protein [Thamnocephalis sphaerospora]|eukprot:RKP11125.1 cytochrome oxidase complex assembly protein 1-domain-containing protein [Thamnocephalis sphaerospora]